MLVYYILVGVILRGGGLRTIRCSSSRRSCRGSGSRRPTQGGIESVVGAERLIKQIYFPKLVLPLATSASGVVSFAFGLIPLVG